MNELLTVKEVQEIIHCGKSKIYQLVNAHGFPKIKIGKQLYIPADELDKWISRNIGKEVMI